MIRKTLLTIAVFVVFLTLIKTFVKIYMADVYYEKSKNELSEGNVKSALINIEKAVKLNKNEPAYLRGRAKVFITLSLNQNEQTADVLKKLALKDLKSAHKLNPHNLATLRNAVTLYYPLALENIDKLEPSPEYLKVTRDYYQNLKTSYPNDAGVIALVAKYEKKLGLDEDYLESVDRIKILRPDLLNWHEAFK